MKIPSPSQRDGLVRLFAAKSDRDLHGFPFAYDRQNDLISRPLRLDDSEQIVRAFYLLTIDSDDQVGLAVIDDFLLHLQKPDAILAPRQFRPAYACSLCRPTRR